MTPDELKQAYKLQINLTHNKKLLKQIKTSPPYRHARVSVEGGYAAGYLSADTLIVALEDEIQSIESMLDKLGVSFEE
jgi:hypothetical protein